MRKTAKKLLALILTLAMLASTFAMAMTTVNAAEDPVYSETFDNVTVNTNGSFNSSWLSGYLLGGTADDQVKVVDGALKVNDLACKYRIDPVINYSTNYTFSFDAKFEISPYLYICFTSADTGNIFQVLNSAIRGYCDHGKGVFGSNAAGPDDNVWYTYTITWNNQTVNLKVVRKSDSVLFHEITQDFSGCNVDPVRPYLMLHNSCEGAAYFDNFAYLDHNEVVLEDGENVINDWKSVSCDFEQGGPSETSGHWFSANSGYGIWIQPGSGSQTGLALTKTEGNGNHYVELSYERTGYAENTRLYLQPSADGALAEATALKSNYYSLSFDTMLPALEDGASGYFGLQVHAQWGTDSTALWRIFNTAVSSYDNHANGSKTVQGEAPAIKADDWVSVKLERNGKTMTLTITDRENPSAVLYRSSRTFDWFTEPSIPRIQFTGDLKKDGATTVTAVACIDNVHYENTTGKLDVVGAQSTTVADSKYSVRFIGTVNSTHAYDTLGFEVVASYTEGGQAKTKTFKLDTCQVYTSILASSSGNEAYVVTANQLGGEYLIALNITDIPTGLGEISFTVKAFGTYNGGIEVRSEVAAFTATPNGTTVDLAKPAV